VTAPNGYGKSTLLRLLADLTAENHVGVGSAYWRTLKIEYESGAVLFSERQVEDDDFKELRYRLEFPGRDPISDAVHSGTLQRFAWESSRWRESQSRRGGQETLPNLGRSSSRAMPDSYPPPRSIRMRREIRRALRIINATYLDVHRLGPRARSAAVVGRWASPSRRASSSTAILEVAKAATAVLRNARLKYLEDSRADEETFANRAVDALNSSPLKDVPTFESVRQQLGQLQRLYKKLGELGLVAPLSPQAMDVLGRLKESNEAALEVILVYCRDVVKRLKRLKSRVRSLEL
jgi:energy-coupling factor transporter ATP-binding protein EcfA2